MKLLICDPLSESATKGLGAIPGLRVVEKTGLSPEELMVTIPTFNIAVVRSATKMRQNILDKAENLKLIIRGGVGLDNIDLAHAEKLGIQVRNTPSASSNSVAELAVAMMFAMARDLYNSTTSMKDGKWEKKRFKGTEIMGKTAGVIGLGRIGRSFAEKAVALGMNVIAFDIAEPSEMPAGVEFTSDLDTLLKKADYISLHVPFIKENGPVLGSEEFAKMKDGVRIVNCARGGVVCEASLLKALDSGKVHAAAIDVFESEPTENRELLSHDRVLALSPHIGAQTKEAQDRVGEEIISIVEEFIS